MEPILPSSAARMHVNLLLFEAFSNMVLACVLEPLRVVRDEIGAPITWTVLTPSDAPVVASSGLTFAPDQPLARAPACDLLIIVGGDRFRVEAQTTTTRQALRLVRKADSVLAADTGAWLLATAGFLAGKEATLHWQLQDEFSTAFPQVRAVNSPFVADGKWMTCGSAAGAMELVLQEIGRRFGAAARFDAVSMFLNAPRLAGDTGFAFGGLPSHPDPRLRRVLELMAATVEAPRNLPDIAKEAGLTLRTMARLFATELGLSPGRCYQHLRLARARELMFQQGMTAADAAPLCGFSCASALKRALSKSTHPIRS